MSVGRYCSLKEFNFKWDAYRIIDKEFHELLFKLSNIIPQGEEFILNEIDRILDRKILKIKGIIK